jgi:hypothetical protein
MKLLVPLKEDDRFFNDRYHVLLVYKIMAKGRCIKGENAVIVRDY